MIGCSSWLKPGTWLENARLAQGLVDYDELLVANWDREVCDTLEQELPGLLALDLRYTVHLPLTNAAQAWQAFQFFEERHVPVLNYVLHPMTGWDSYQWNNLVAIENLKDILVFHSRMVFDIGHHLLGRRVPDSWKLSVVEIHAMGVRDGRDHLPLDTATAELILPWITERTFVTFEVFDLDGLKSSIETWRTVHV